MSKPHDKPYSRTVFVVEGITKAVVVTSIGRKRSQGELDFPTPEAALAWCRTNHAGMVYSPSQDHGRN